MAYTMTHILIAERLLEDLKTPVDHSTFILGAIAPDAVHAAKTYSVEQKERSHLLPEGQRWGRITHEQEYEIWLDRIASFYHHDRDKYDPALFLGYIVHLLTDVCSKKQIFAPFYLSITDNYAQKIAQFQKESFAVNYHLYREYARERDLYAILRKGRSCSIDGLIDKDLLDARIDQLFSHEFKEQELEDLSGHQICTVENTEKLIQEKAAIIEDLFLNDRFSLIF